MALLSRMEKGKKEEALAIIYGHVFLLPSHAAGVDGEKEEDSLALGKTSSSATIYGDLPDREQALGWARH